MGHTLTRSLILGLAIVLASMSVRGQVASQSPGLQIIPQPKQLNALPEAFRFRRDNRILLANPGSDDDRFAAQDFIDDLKASAGVALVISKGRSHRGILVGRIDLPQIREVLRQAGLEVQTTLNT